MFIAHYQIDAVPTLTADVSMNGPDRVRVNVTDDDHFYITVDQAFAFAAAIHAAASAYAATLPATEGEMRDSC